MTFMFLNQHKYFPSTVVLLQKNSLNHICLIWGIFASISCKKLIDIDPQFITINSENVYSDDATAIAVLTGIYTNMSAVSFSAQIFLLVRTVFHCYLDYLPTNFL